MRFILIETLNNIYYPSINQNPNQDFDKRKKSILREANEQAYEVLAQAKEARMQILDLMESVIPEPRKELSAYAPKIARMDIPVDKIRDVIGAGGKVINEIIAQCNDVKIDIEQDGRVMIYHNEYEPIENSDYPYINKETGVRFKKVDGTQNPFHYIYSYSSTTKYFWIDPATISVALATSIDWRLRHNDLLF